MMAGKKISSELKAARKKYPKDSYFRVRETFVVYQVGCVKEYWSGDDDVPGEIYIFPKTQGKGVLKPLCEEICEPFVFNEEKVK
jgi:hypothetical protein